ncbi:MAG: hypothetical protein EOP84_01745 [Verrucomicrobiaceae bacterium]|nr:MAG: hypothetical protein EOP84_01745 [Verrucomicrobiaceae bacterium]
MSSRETKRRLMTMEKSFGMYIPDQCFDPVFRKGGSRHGEGWMFRMTLTQTIDLKPEDVYKHLIPEVVEWLKTNVAVRRIDYRYISFQTTDDLFAFKLRWG